MLSAVGKASKIKSEFFTNIYVAQNVECLCEIPSDSLVTELISTQGLCVNVFWTCLRTGVVCECLLNRQAMYHLSHNSNYWKKPLLNVQSEQFLDGIWLFSLKEINSILLNIVRENEWIMNSSDYLHSTVIIISKMWQGFSFFLIYKCEKTSNLSYYSTCKFNKFTWMNLKCT